MSTPSITISPPAIGTSFMIALPSVDLPQPDLPTSPSGLADGEIEADAAHRAHDAAWRC